MDINRDKEDNFILKGPLATVEFFFSSLGGVTTTIIYLICGIVFDRTIKNYKISNLLALAVAVAIGYGVQKGVFTLRETPDMDEKHKFKMLSKYIISELFGVVIHQMLFIQFLVLPVIMPVLIQNTLLRMLCSSLVFIVLFFLRKYWVFV